MNMSFLITLKLRKEHLFQNIFYKEFPNPKVHSSVLYNFESTLRSSDIYNVQEVYVFPVLKIWSDTRLVPSNPRLTNLEKSKIILDSFLNKIGYQILNHF